MSCAREANRVTHRKYDSFRTCQIGIAFTCCPMLGPLIADASHFTNSFPKSRCISHIPAVRFVLLGVLKSVRLLHALFQHRHASCAGHPEIHGPLTRGVQEKRGGRNGAAQTGRYQGRELHGVSGEERAPGLPPGQDGSHHNPGRVSDIRHRGMPRGTDKGEDSLGYDELGFKDGSGLIVRRCDFFRLTLRVEIKARDEVHRACSNNRQ